MFIQQKQRPRGPMLHIERRNIQGGDSYGQEKEKKEIKQSFIKKSSQVSKEINGKKRHKRTLCISDLDGKKRKRNKEAKKMRKGKGRSVKGLKSYARRTPKKTMVRRLQKKMGKTAAEKVASGMKKWAKK